MLNKFLAGFQGKEGGKIPAWPQTFLSSLPSSSSSRFPPLSASPYFPVVPGGEGGSGGAGEELPSVMSTVPGLHLAHRRVSLDDGAGAGKAGREGGKEGTKGVKVEAVPVVARRWGRASAAPS